MVSFLPQKQINYTEIKKILSASVDQNHFTNGGPVKRKLELCLEKLLSIDNSKRIVCCANGTAALHSILFLCAEKHGCGDWLTPAFTFPSCVVGHEFKMDVLDIDADTYTLPLDESTVRGYDGVVITNLFGAYSNLAEWAKLCKDTDTILIFDNAASPLSTFEDVNICNFGDYSFGSLHHTKYLGFGEGGFIVCPAEDYDSLNSVTNFGFFYGSSGGRQFKHTSSNYKMSDVSAAFILSHVRAYDLTKHIKNQNRLVNSISAMDHAKPFNHKPGTVYNTLPVLFDRAVDESYFYSLGIRAHKYYKPLFPLPNSLDLYSRIINFPLYADLTAEQIERIIETIGEF